MAQKSTARPPAAPAITHYGTVTFDFKKGALGSYSRASGSTNWSVGPIPWPNGPVPTPSVGQVLISFAAPIKSPYSVIVTACRTPDAPMLTANYGNATPGTFEILLYDPIALLSYRTVRNGDFSFVVLQ